MAVSLIFLILALVCFVIAALGVNTGQISMRDAGYACLVCWLIAGAA